ncbi:MAG: hypothetical protein DAHOPDDO_00184 [Ignavibacteriaceae bacterium]|nr:hypothetical protein [Ignavibacteriaceae bacterium]
MKKIILMLLFILLSTTNIFGQAAVDIPLSVTEGIITYEFAVGLDIIATNCVDTLLGECIGEPPIPPSGVYSSNLILPSECGQVSACKDYRPPGNPPAFPFSGLVVHTLWWQVSSPGIPLDITYILPVGTVLWITDNITGALLNLGPFTGQGVATIPGSYTTFGTKALLKMQYDNIVPIELTSFTTSVLQNEKAVQLNWSTATETNNSGFEINRKKLEARSQELEWENIGFVPGFGTTTELKSYSFNDENVTTGTYKYRLKQIDFDGSFEYLPIGQAGSNEIEVEVDFTPKKFVLFQNYPNPFNPSTVITFEIPGQARNDNVLVTLKVYDILGNKIVTLVNEEKQPGVYEVEFDASTLASGMYLYKLQAGSFIQTKKMIFTK